MLIKNPWNSFIHFMSLKLIRTTQKYLTFLNMLGVLINKVLIKIFTFIFHSGAALRISNRGKSFQIGAREITNWGTDFKSWQELQIGADHLLLTVSGFQSGTLLKKRIRQRCFSVNLVKFSRTSFDRMPVNFEKFVRTPLLYSTSGKLLISCTSCRISTCRYSKKLFHRCFSSILKQKAPFRRRSFT